MQIAFIITALLGLTLFGFRKRRFDFYSLAFMCACIYFMPGFLDYVLYPSTSTNIATLGERVPISNDTYSIMIFVLCTIGLSSILYDFISIKPKKLISLHGSRNCPSIFFCISLIALAFSFATSGSAIFSANKNNMLESLNRWFVLFEVSTALLMATAFYYRSTILLIFGALFVVFSMYVGFRGVMAISIMSVFLIFFHQGGENRIAITQRKYLLYGLIAALVLMAYKGIYVAVKSGNWDVVLDNVFNGDFYLFWISNAEPFITQAILNKVIEHDFRTDMDHIHAAFYQLVLFAPQLGMEDISFNDYFQQHLFPNIKGWSMANNIWAQMYSAGGWFGLIIFSLLFSLSLGILSRLLLVFDGALAAIIVVLGVNWVFFIHRNDISYQLVMEKRIFLLALAVLTMGDIISKIPHKIRLKTTSILEK